MGRAKGAMSVDGKPLALAAAERLAQLCDSVCISVAAGAENPAPGFAAIEDAPGESRGPLGGIAAAFDAVGERDLLILACDYPRVTAELLHSIMAASKPEAAVTMAAGERDHPLVALWHRSMRTHVERALQAGALRVLDLIVGVSVLRVTGEPSGRPEHERQLINVNRPEDLARLDASSGE